jgi:hypothetical protein
MVATISLSSKEIESPAMPKTLDAGSVGISKVLNVEDVALLQREG